jgi:hydrogenase nickel incorporation protein HypB
VSDTDASRTIEIHEALLGKNEALAERNRAMFRARGLTVINVLSSPGSGKTTFVQRTIADLKGRRRIGVIVGDLATDNDARRLRETGAPVVQIVTGTVCHLDAEMVARAAERVGLDDLDTLIVENVGNLVCPSAYDLGESLRVVLLSTTEGEDKPLKYPSMFQTADIVVVNKIDLAEAVEFDREAALRAISDVAPGAQVVVVSAKTGVGMEAWYACLEHRVGR